MNDGFLVRLHVTFPVVVIGHTPGNAPMIAQ